MEYASIERELHIDASPEVVFEVISRPEHLREWWPDDATLEPTPGSVGEIVFGDRSDDEAKVVAITVVEANPHRLFSFRWVHPQGEAASSTNSFLVTFTLDHSDAGTLLRMTETGFREQGWTAAVVEETYRDHEQGWDHFIPRLGRYADGLVASR